MDVYGTDLINRSYSGVSDQNESEFNRIDYLITNNSSKADVYNVKAESIKRNTSNPTIAKLSAQVMNLPYDEFKESVSIEAFQNPIKNLFEEDDIFRRIKEAYDACSCKICRCLTGNSFIPRKEHCDCEPCKCQDCMNMNIQLHSRIKVDNDNYVYGYVKARKCDCKPCDCTECVQNCGFRDQTGCSMKKKAVILNNMATKLPVRQNSIHENYQMQDTVSDRPIPTIYKTYSSNTECSICDLSSSSSSIRYCDKTSQKLQNSKHSKCSNYECQLCFHKKQPDPQLINYNNCTYNTCECEQCVRKCVRKIILQTDNNYGGTGKAGCVVNPTEYKPSRVCTMCKAPLTNECNEYAQTLQSAAQSNKPKKTNHKSKRGNILYVNNAKIYSPIKTFLKPVPPRVKENYLALLLDKDTNQIKINKKRSQLSQMDNAKSTLTASSITNFHTPNEVASVRLSLVEDVPMNNIQETNWFTSSPGFRSTQAISVSSSLFSCQNKGCSTRAISLPDTNIVDDFTEICPDSNFNAFPKHYAKKHNIYHMQTSSNSVRLIYNGNLDDNQNMGASNLLFDHFDKYFSKSRCNTEQTTKVDYESVHNTLYNAKKFTFKLTKILHMYEKANSDFVSVSEGLRKSLMKLNGSPDMTKCDGIQKQVDAVEEEYRAAKPKKINKTAITSSEIKNNKGKNQLLPLNPTLTNPIKKVRISIYQDTTEHSEQAETIKSTKNEQDESEDNTEKVYDKAINAKILVKSALDEESQVYSNFEVQESTASKVEILREKKIWDILQRTMMLDGFTQENSSPVMMTIF